MPTFQIENCPLSAHLARESRLDRGHRDLDGLLLVHNPRFLQLLEDARQRVRVTGGIPLAELRRRLDESSSQETMTASDGCR